MDDLLFLLEMGAIDTELLSDMWKSPAVTADLGKEYADIVLQEHTIANVEDKLRICLQSLNDGQKITLTQADEISKLGGVTIKNGFTIERYFVFDNTDILHAALFGLKMIVHTKTSEANASSEVFTKEGLEEATKDGNFIYPIDYVKMSFVHLLHDKTQFLERFAAEYLTEGREISQSLIADYEEFLKKMNAVFRITLFERVKRVFETPKEWECKILECGVEIQLDTYSDNVKTQTKLALERFIKTKTVVTGQIIQTTLNERKTAFLYKDNNGEAEFTPLLGFYEMPVDPDKIWNVLKNFRLMSSYIEKLPIEIIEKLPDEKEQHYAKRMITWQAQAGGEQKTVTKTTTLEQRLKYMMENETLAKLKSAKQLNETGKKANSTL
jgi:hypothetical protein